MTRFISVKEAAQLVKDEQTVAFGGFGAYCSPEALLNALGERFEETGSPRNLTSLTGISTGDNSHEMCGMNRVAKEGLIGTIIAGHMGNAPLLSRLAAQNQAAAFCLPLGVVMNLYRAIAAKRPGVLTTVGLGTYADPQQEGCMANEKARSSGREVVRSLFIDDRRYLFYPSFGIDICFLRGTYADEDGNISFDHEAVTGAELEIASAVRSSGGIVVVQVEKVLARGSIHPKKVRLHHTLVDYVVQAPPEMCAQSFAANYRPELSGEVRCPVSAIEPMPMSVRKVIARRAAMALVDSSVINLGIGLPSGVGSVANEEGIAALLSLESGPIGGVPVEGLGFGASVDPDSILPLCNNFDLYDGGFLDMTFLGAAEIDQNGNVNVSKFGTRSNGPGGFIDISQNTPKVFFLSSFSGTARKFVGKVQQITFSADYARSTGQEVYYITEMAVFRLAEEGIELIEIAPDTDLEQDILAKMDFRPLIADNLKVMDSRLFEPKHMEIMRHE